MDLYDYLQNMSENRGKITFVYILWCRSRFKLGALPHPDGSVIQLYVVQFCTLP